MMLLKRPREMRDSFETKVEGNELHRAMRFQGFSRLEASLFVEPFMRAKPKSLLGQPFQLPAGNLELGSEDAGSKGRILGDLYPLLLAIHLDP